MAKYLKTQNLPQISLFIVWCWTIYAVIFSNSDFRWSTLQTKFVNLNQQDSLVILIMPILILILSGIIKPSLKAKLTFWRWMHPLPGCRVFTELAPADYRIDMKILKEKLSGVPNEPQKQNALWYRLFKKYEEKVTVLNAHKNFLLARDLAIIALLFTIGGIAGLIIGGTEIKSLKLYFLIMCSHYVLLSIVAQNHGNRLVCNVLAEYINDKN